MIKSILLLLLLLFCQAFYLSSQSTINETQARHNQSSISNVDLMSVYGVNTFDLKDYSTEGSPYLKDYFIEGDVTLYDNKVLFDVPLKFNIEDQTLLIRFNGQYFVLPNSTFTRFCFKEMSNNGIVAQRQFVRITDEKALESKYYEILKENESVAFALFHDVKFVKASYNPAIDVGNHRGRYIAESEHGLIVDKTYISLKGSKKKILRSIPDERVTSHISKMDINLKDHDELSAMIENLEF